MTVVAVGPGDPRMLTMKGRHALEEADLVVGFKTVLDVVAEWTTEAEANPFSSVGGAPPEHENSE